MMRIAGLAILISVIFTACGPKPTPPISGADLVANAVAAHYEVRVDRIDRTPTGFEWTLTAINHSEYAWRGKLIVKFLDASNKIVGSQSFTITEMVPPGGTTSGLRFVSAEGPVERGGRVARLKVEVDVTEYKEPRK